MRYHNEIFLCWWKGQIAVSEVAGVGLILVLQVLDVWSSHGWSLSSVIE